MSNGLFSRMVIRRIIVLAPLFSMIDEELITAINYANRLGWIQAKPTSIALALIRISKPDLRNSTIYAIGHINMQTLRQWVCFCCDKLDLEEHWF
jgi:hypothetical protein